MKKAMELSILCDCELAMIVFGANNKVFPYASSDMDKLLQRYSQLADQQKPLVNSDYARVFGRKGKSGDEKDGKDEVEREEVEDIIEEEEARGTLQPPHELPPLTPRTASRFTEALMHNKSGSALSAAGSVPPSPSGLFAGSPLSGRASPFSVMSLYHHSNDLPDLPSVPLDTPREDGKPDGIQTRSRSNKKKQLFVSIPQENPSAHTLQQSNRAENTPIQGALPGPTPSSSMFLQTPSSMLHLDTPSVFSAWAGGVTPGKQTFQGPMSPASEGFRPITPTQAADADFVNNLLTTPTAGKSPTAQTPIGRGKRKAFSPFDDLPDSAQAHTSARPFSPSGEPTTHLPAFPAPSSARYSPRTRASAKSSATPTEERIPKRPKA